MKTQISQIAPSEAQAKSDALWLDVRAPVEFTATHIEGSLLHPLPQLDIAEIKGRLEGNRACILVCRSGNRANQAAEQLAAAGIGPLHVLEGGIQAWEAAGLPVNRGAAGISLQRQVMMVAGSFVLTGTLLGHFVHPGFFIIPAFFGAGLLFAGLTDTCALGMMLARMPWNQQRTA